MQKDALPVFSINDNNMILRSLLVNSAEMRRLNFFSLLYFGCWIAQLRKSRLWPHPHPGDGSSLWDCLVFLSPF